MNECWHLVDEGILNVKDVDTVMSEGLGMRYAFLGPLETAHLNAEGLFFISLFLCVNIFITYKLYYFLICNYILFNSVYYVQNYFGIPQIFLRNLF